MSPQICVEMEEELWLLLRLHEATVAGSSWVCSAPGDERLLAPLHGACVAAAWRVNAGAWTVLVWKKVRRYQHRERLSTAATSSGRDRYGLPRNQRSSTAPRGPAVATAPWPPRGRPPLRRPAVVTVPVWASSGCHRSGCQRCPPLMGGTGPMGVSKLCCTYKWPIFISN